MEEITLTKSTQRSLVDVIIDLTKPGSRNGLAFDGFRWDGNNILILDGDHGTPFFKVEFLTQGSAMVTNQCDKSRTMTVRVYTDDLYQTVENLIYAFLRLK